MQRRWRGAPHLLQRVGVQLVGEQRAQVVGHSDAQRLLGGHQRQRLRQGGGKGAGRAGGQDGQAVRTGGRSWHAIYARHAPSQCRPCQALGPGPSPRPSQPSRTCARPVTIRCADRRSASLSGSSAWSLSTSSCGGERGRGWQLKRWVSTATVGKLASGGGLEAPMAARPGTLARLLHAAQPARPLAPAAAAGGPARLRGHARDGDGAVDDGGDDLHDRAVHGHGHLRTVKS